MKKTIFNNRTTIAAVSICLFIGAITMSFQNNFYSPVLHYSELTEEPNDTLPEKKDHNKLTMKEFEKLVKNFDTEMKKAQEEINKIDAEKMNAELNASLQKINTGEIKLAIDKAMQEIDFAGIEKDIRDAMKNIEWNNISEEVKKSLTEAKKTMEQIDMTVIKKELDEARTTIEKSKTELVNINLPKIMAEAREGIKKAGESLRKQKAMFDAMQQDGLINQQKGFSIVYKKGELYINGKKQPDSIVDKYRSYLDKEDYEITIEQEKE